MKLADPIVFPPFRLDPVTEQLWRESELVSVPPKTFAVLRYLAENAGRLITKEELLKAIWPDIRVSAGILKGYIRDLREVLGDNSQTPRFIETRPRRGYRFIGQVVKSQQLTVSAQDLSNISNVASPSSQRQTSPSIPLVGRESELQQFQVWLEKALRGERQVVFVTGESGIGKTTLAAAFLEHVEAKGGVGIGRGQCVEQYGAGEAYLPILEALERLGRGPEGKQLIEVFKRYAPTWLLQLSTLVDDAELDAIQRKVQGATRERMLRELAEAFEVLTAETPVILLLEDLHWSDYATIDSLSLLAQRREAARLLVIGTYRPAEIAVSDHPLKAAKRELQVHGRCVELALNFLTEQAVADYLSIRFAGAPLPSALARMIHQGTDGNALFMVNIEPESAGNESGQ